MRTERTMLMERIRAVTEKREASQRALHDMELAFQKKQVALKAHIEQYNDAAADIAATKKTDNERVQEVKRRVLIALQFSEGGAKPMLSADKAVVKVRARGLLAYLLDTALHCTCTALALHGMALPHNAQVGATTAR
jgi:hypothetical protein